MRFHLLLPLVFCLTLSSTSKADLISGLPWYFCEEAVVDNLNVPTTGTVDIGSGSSSAFPNRGAGQLFYNPVDGRLSRILVSIQRLDLPRYNITLKLYEVGDFGRIESDATAQVELFRFFVTSLPDRTAEFSFRDQEVYLEGDKNYFFSIFANDGDVDYQYRLPYDDGANYTGGARYQVWRDDSNWAFQSSGDLRFQVLSVVPEPSPFLLLSTVATGLVIRRLKCKQSDP